MEAVVRLLIGFPLAIVLGLILIPLTPVLVALGWAMGMEVSRRTTLGEVFRYLGGKLL